MINAAVRLNALGPYLAQRLLTESQVDVKRAWEKAKDLRVEDARMTAPVVELAMGLHGRLYSRLFSS